MFSHPIQLRRSSAFLCWLVLCSTGIPQCQSVSPHADNSAPDSAQQVRFVREFSRAEDVQRELHPILNRSLDIVAGPADAHPPIDKLISPQAVITDATGRVFVADPEAGVVHVFDFAQSRYTILKDRENRMRSPVALALDRDDNLYVADTGLAAVLVFDSKGKFLRYLGKDEGEESYFESPVSLAIDLATRHIFVCDSRRHMVLVLDRKARIISHIGKRGGGSQPGEFRYPSRVAVSGDELFVLDSGNSRLQVLDLTGHFRREVRLAEANLSDGLAVDDRKNIYVADTQINAVNVFDRAGQFVYKFGGTGAKSGEFHQPSGLWIDSRHSNLYVADTRNRRIQMFEIAGPR